MLDDCSSQVRLISYALKSKFNMKGGGSWAMVHVGTREKAVLYYQKLTNTHTHKREGDLLCT